MTKPLPVPQRFTSPWYSDMAVGNYLNVRYLQYLGTAPPPVLTGSSPPPPPSAGRFPWLTPVLSPRYVAEETITALKKREEILFFPKWMYPAFLFSR